MQLKNRRSGL